MGHRRDYRPCIGHGADRSGEDVDGPVVGLG